jgi:alkylation response protein AidB-like acyl-CoA dehydrogenase
MIQLTEDSASSGTRFAGWRPNGWPHGGGSGRREEFPIHSYEAFKEHGLLKLALPRPFGGLEADATTLSLVIQEIARACPSRPWWFFRLRP